LLLLRRVAGHSRQVKQLIPFGESVYAMFGFLQNLNCYAVIPFVFGLESIHSIFILHYKFARRASGIVEKKYRKNPHTPKGFNISFPG
jgi:hypothetical protein